LTTECLEMNLLASRLTSDEGFLFGYDSGIISSTIAQPLFVEYFGNPSNSEVGGIVSAFTGGAILGALSISWLADYFGRKMTVFIGAVISVFGCALQGGAATIGMLIAGRLIAGLAVGLLSAIVPMYCVRYPKTSRVYDGWLANGISLRSQQPKIAGNSAASCSSCSRGASSSLNG
jgi:MFS family permease